jgi:predicted O-methyltransferase YrrM
MKTKDQILNEISKNWKQKHFNTEQRDIFVDLLMELKPSYCLETGFCTGASSATILGASNPKKLISVGLEHNSLEVAEKLEHNYNFKLVQGDSTKILTSEFFEREFANGIDFYHVDGGHSYQVALKDLENAYPFMNKDSIIVVDDYRSKICPIQGVNDAVDFFVQKNSLNMEWVYTKKGKGMAVISL